MKSSVKIMILIAFMSALFSLGNSAQSHVGESQQATSQSEMIPPERVTKVTIATVADSLSVPTSRYRVGDQVLIAINMYNTSADPLSVCISSDLYQNLPKLTKDGKLVPYMNWQSYERLNAQRENTCKAVNLPEPVLLKPKETKLSDWFVLVDSSTSTGAEAWYDSLSPGKYELSIQRRLSCCDGPMVESNKISFEVLP